MRPKKLIIWLLFWHPSIILSQCTEKNDSVFFLSILLLLIHFLNFKKENLDDKFKYNFEYNFSFFHLFRWYQLKAFVIQDHFNSFANMNCESQTIIWWNQFELVSRTKRFKSLGDSQVSISSTFYEQLFCAKVIWAAICT